MLFEEELLRRLEDISSKPWEGTAWRHVLGDRDPLQPSVHGGRWNPPDTVALYTSLRRETAIAEGDRLLAVQPVPPRVRRYLYEVRLELARVLDLSSMELLKPLGVDRAALGSDDHTPCRAVGGAAAWLGNDGILVPSARHDGVNLVVFID